MMKSKWLLTCTEKVYARYSARYNKDDEKSKVKNKEIMKMLKGDCVIRTVEKNLCGFLNVKDKGQIKQFVIY